MGRQAVTRRGSMYVCICNAVTEDDVRCCVGAGAGSTRQVKQACGWKPGCGTCARRLADTVAAVHGGYAAPAAGAA